MSERYISNYISKKYNKKERCMDIIKSIQIKNIKGIDDKTFNLNLIPNKPNLIVAHNGFGKSSFTAAFKSLHHNGIILDFCDVHLMNNKLSPEINMIITQNRNTTNLTADNAKNEIKKYFDIVVINNPMVAKKRHTQSYTVAVLAIDDIIINNKIPLAANFEYEPKNISNLQNISELLNHQDLICDLKERKYYEKLRSKRKYQHMEC